MTWSLGPLAFVAFSAIVLVVALVYSERLRAKLYPPDKFWPYHARRVLSGPEQVLYRRLARALPDSMVLAKLPLAEVIGVKRAAYADAWTSRIAEAVVDFVVCREDSTAVVVIELEDAGTRGSRSIRTDRFTDNALAAAGIALLRWNADALPSESEIRRLIAQERGRTTATDQKNSYSSCARKV
jgi:hypothetical protein